jgi:hypothetical protein
LPSKTARQLPDLSTIIRVEPSSTGDSRLQGALPLRDLSTCNKVWVYSITSSARNRIDCGMVTPSAFAVFRLITSSNFVGCRTGMSAGLAPLRISTTWPAIRR